MRLVLWGQSLGAGVALVAAAADGQATGARKDSGDGTERVREDEGGEGEGKRSLAISGILLETPFISVRAMLPALYPEKWLPYRYLGPFLTNHWDSEEALRKIGAAASSGAGEDSNRPLAHFAQDDCVASKAGPRPQILILQAGRDEIVPKEHAVRLETVCKEVGLPVKKVEVGGALHTEILVRAGGRRAAVEFLQEIAKS